ncbi:MAG: hypothetical protein H0W99_18085 [Acidobacteria bacterium]|nr:hypothetical protein [Acidobacteriota bacterium]
MRAAALVAFAFGLSPLASGQNKEYEDAMRAEQQRRAGENERRLSSWELQMAEKRRPPAQQRDASLAYAQIREDYKQIQIVNNDLARSVSAARGILDFKYVAKSVSDIKKRALRLKENLVLPEAKESVERSRPEVGTETEKLKSSLSVLDKLILGFVNNPIFEQAKTVDVQISAKARRDLEEIIEVSDQIKKSSEKLQKVAQKTQ